MSKKRDLLQTTHAHTPESPCWCWEQQDETRQIGSTGGKHQKSSGDSMGSPGRSCLALGKPSNYGRSIISRRDPERGLQSWFRPAKPETRNPKPTVKVGFELRNPKPETRNPKPTLKTYLPQDRSKPETRNPKPTLKT